VIMPPERRVSRARAAPGCRSGRAGLAGALRAQKPFGLAVIEELNSGRMDSARVPGPAAADCRYWCQVPSPAPKGL